MDAGGPTGLFTGLLLHRLGVSVTIVDAKPGPLELGRADALNARTQQYLEVADLLDELLPIGLKCNTSSTFAEGEFKSRQNAWWVGLEHALHKNFLMIGQPVIEDMLTSKLDGLVRFNEQVVSVTEDVDSVQVATQSGSKIRSRYAVGADGARSLVRKQIGASFTGEKPEMTWAVLDTFIETDFPLCPEIITFQHDGQSRVSWIPRERGMCRFYVLLEGQVTQALAEDSIRKHLAPHTVAFKKTEWYSTFDVKERIASSFISNDGGGRIILAGDAAHVHSVNGGQGLNTGMSDAFSLAWRLATAIKAKNLLQPGAVEKVIRSYDTERRNTARDVIDVAARLVRDTVHTGKQYVGTIEKNAGYITGMGVTYGEFGSPLVKASEHGIWKAGNRCPDMVLSKSDGMKTRLYTEVTYGKFIVLQIGANVAATTTLGFSDMAVPYSIHPQADTTDAPTRGFHSDAENAVHTYTADWVSEDDDGVYVVVRPDMYLGYVGRDVEEVKQYLGELYTT